MGIHDAHRRRTIAGEMSLRGAAALFFFTFLFASISPGASDFKTIDTALLHSMVVDNAYRIEGGRQKQFAVIDVRTKEEYAESHIFSAISIPEEEFERFAPLLPKEKSAKLAVYCSDNRLGTCTKWAARAAAHGYTNIVIYSEGFSAWKAQHMPIAPLGDGH
jgi:rhodanese-related sulfurtransferase